MSNHLPTFSSVLLLLFLCAVPTHAIPNLVPDASFESPLPSWFSEEGQGSYFAGKEKVAGASAGNIVLVIAGWERGGSRILSPPFALTSRTYSATIDIRSSGAAPGASLELALFDAEGTHKLLSFGTTALEGQRQWKTLSGAGKELTAPANQGRLGIVVSGPQARARVEVDKVGLFAGNQPEPVVDNAEVTWFEAEEMADGMAWKVQDHYSGWYADLPSGMKMLAGADGVPEAANHPARKSMVVRLAGPHRLWVRLMRTDPVNRGKYTISVEQNGKVLASQEIDDGDPRYGPDHTWVWVPLEADLEVGTAQVVLSRPSAGTSWVARKLDLFLLTNLLDYKPSIQDLRPKGYLSFTNLSTDQAPFCLWMFVRRHQPPLYYANPGILSASGLSGSYYVPEDKSKWLAPGQSSPWVRVTDYLLPGGGRNNVQWIATRATHTTGFVNGRVRGRLDFALGVEHLPLRTIEINQEAPRILMTLPYDFLAQRDQIYTPFDYLQKARAVLDKIGDPLAWKGPLPARKGDHPSPGLAARAPTAKHLDLNVILSLDRKLDDPEILEQEIENIKRLGFNGTYTPVTDPQEAGAFYAAHGLQQHFGMWNDLFSLLKNGDQNQPDTEKMRSLLQGEAQRFAPILDRVERMKIADEPGGMPYEHFVSCPVCRGLFAADLRARGLTPRDLGVANWEEVVPVPPEKSEEHPELFYYTALFRLESFARLARVCEEVKRQYLPVNVRPYVNYSPPLSERLTWVQCGTDPFLAQRGGGLEMSWTEDWLGYGASPEQISPIVAILRSAGASGGEPLGAYDVGVSGGPLLQRIKYYELLAGGVRHVDVYSYGPFYAGIDSWSTQYDIYPSLSRVQHELGRIDEPLFGTTRRKTDTAILYNRTAAIWAKNTSTSEQDSRYIHWALAHAGYDADFLPEEDIDAGKLAACKVLYLDGPQIRRSTAQKIADWTAHGGVLFGSAGAGSLDEFNRPLDTLEKVFGARSQDLKLERDAARPKYELRSLPVSGVLSTVEGAGAPAVSLDQLCFQESLIPTPGAVVILRDAAGKPAGVLNHFGKGTAIRVAAVPGISYLHDAVKDKAYDPESYLPQNYRPDLRDFIAWPAKLAGAVQTAQTSAPISEVVRYEGQAREVVFVIDHASTPRPDFRMTLPGAAAFRRAYTASGAPVQLKRLPSGELQVQFSLDAADAVVLER